MIVKALFLVNIIHRISTRNIHDKNSLHENVSGYPCVRRIPGKPLGGAPGKRTGRLRRGGCLFWRWCFVLTGLRGQGSPCSPFIYPPGVSEEGLSHDRGLLPANRQCFKISRVCGVLPARNVVQFARTAREVAVGRVARPVRTFCVSSPSRYGLPGAGAGYFSLYVIVWSGSRGPGDGVPAMGAARYDWFFPQVEVETFEVPGTLCTLCDHFAVRYRPDCGCVEYAKWARDVLVTSGACLTWRPGGAPSWIVCR
jgi:hypothetical protein